MTLAAAMLVIPYPVAISDTWMLVLSGRYFLAHGVRAMVDPFSYAAPNLYIEHEWLPAMLFALLVDRGGWPALWGWKVGMAAVMLTLPVWLALRLGASWGVLALTFLPWVYVVASRISERPGLLGSCLLLSILAFWVQVRGRTWRPWVLWLLPVLMILYINCHGGWVQGMALLSVMLVVEAGHWGRARSLGSGRALPGRVIGQLAAALLVSGGALLLNPYGAALLVNPFRLQAMDMLRESNFEWMSLERWLYATGVGWGYLAHVAALSVAWVVGQRTPLHSRQRCLLGAVLGISGTLAVLSVCAPPTGKSFNAVADVPAVQHAVTWGYTAILGCWVVGAVLWWRTVDLVPVVLVLLFGGLSVAYGRAVPDTVMLTYPWLAATWTTVLRRWAPGRRWDQQTLVLGALGSLVLTGWIVVQGGVPYGWQGRAGRLAWVPWRIDGRAYPLCATAFLTRHGLSGRAWTSLDTAPATLAARWPALRVSMDTRDVLYGDQVQYDQMMALRQPAVMAQQLARYQPDVIFLPHEEVRSRAVYRLLYEQGWRYVYMDDRYFIMVPWRVTTATLMAQEAYTHIIPWENRDVTAANAPQVLAEAERALERCPTYATFAWSYKAKALHAMGRYAEAAAAGRHIPTLLYVIGPGW
jgi:hypothetical protein